MKITELGYVEVEDFLLDVLRDFVKDYDKFLEDGRDYKEIQEFIKNWIKKGFGD
jgi:hypothetical protein